MPFGGPRGEYFLYLAILLGLVLLLVRWPRIAGVLLVLAAFELAWGAGLFALHRAGLAASSLMPPAKLEPQRFVWHPLLQSVPIPSLKLTSSTGLPIQHTREGTRGKDPEGSLDGRTVIAVFGGSTTYDIGAGEGETWPDRLAQALDKERQGALLRRQSRRAGLHHGRAPDPDGVLPDQVRQAAALRDLLCRLERPAQCAHPQPRSRPTPTSTCRARSISQKVRRVGGSHVTVSPLLTLLMRVAADTFDTARYFKDPYSRKPVSGDDPTSRRSTQQHRARSRRSTAGAAWRTIWVGQLLNRERLMRDDGLYGWLPLVRDRDLWPLQQQFNAILEAHGSRPGRHLYRHRLRLFRRRRLRRPGPFLATRLAAFRRRSGADRARACR